jgi:hypothetical protein
MLVFCCCGKIRFLCAEVILFVILFLFCMCDIPYVVCRCLQYITELLDMLTKNIETIIAREYVTEETESEKFGKVL